MTHNTFNRRQCASNERHWCTFNLFLGYICSFRQLNNIFSFSNMHTDIHTQLGLIKKSAFIHLLEWAKSNWRCDEGAQQECRAVTRSTTAEGSSLLLIIVFGKIGFLVALHISYLMLSRSCTRTTANQLHFSYIDVHLLEFNLVCDAHK